MATKGWLWMYMLAPQSCLKKKKRKNFKKQTLPTGVTFGLAPPPVPLTHCWSSGASPPFPVRSPRVSDEIALEPRGPPSSDPRGGGLSPVPRVLGSSPLHALRYL